MPMRRAAIVLVLVALAGLGWWGATRDTSALAKFAEGLELERDVAYGPDPRQRLDLVRARGGGPRPALLMIHPGGWSQGDKSAYHGWMPVYARLGYVCVSVNFRPTYPAAIDDVRSALRWLRARPDIDPARIGVTGWSSGAHLALLIALEGEERVRAAVAVSGVYDFLMERSGAFPNSGTDPVVVAFLGGAPRRIPDVARRASPFHHLTADDPPLLVFHGERDRRIDVEQARQLASALEALGRSDEVVILPGLDHGRDVFPGDEESRRKIRDFFGKHLKP